MFHSLHIYQSIKTHKSATLCRREAKTGHIVPIVLLSQWNARTYLFEPLKEGLNYINFNGHINKCDKEFKRNNAGLWFNML